MAAGYAEERYSPSVDLGCGCVRCNCWSSGVSGTRTLDNGEAGGALVMLAVLTYLALGVGDECSGMASSLSLSSPSVSIRSTVRRALVRTGVTTRGDLGVQTQTLGPLERDGVVAAEAEWEVDVHAKGVGVTWS